MNNTFSASLLKASFMAFAISFSTGCFADNNSLPTTIDNTAFTNSKASITNYNLYTPTSTIQKDSIDEKVYEVADKMPEFVGGIQELMKYISQHVTYPKIAEECEVEGRIVVQFVVMEDGSIARTKIVWEKIKPQTVKSLGDEIDGIPVKHYTRKPNGEKYLYQAEYDTSVKALENEALRVVGSMPNWIPGEKDGKKIKVKYNVPLNFNLSSNNSTPQALKQGENKPRAGESDYKMPQELGPNDKKPQFGKGVKQLMRYLTDHVKYPKIAKECKVEGRIVVSFVVTEDGSVTRVKVAKSEINKRRVKHIDSIDPNLTVRHFTPKLDGGDYLYESEYNTSVKALQEEAIRLVSTMPKWTPGEKDGKKVKVRFNLPVSFNLPKYNAYDHLWGEE